MAIKRLSFCFIAIFISSLVPVAAFADAILPAPQQLVTMSIQQRLALFKLMQTLPVNQRDANLNALRDEIDALTPAQKQEMADRFRSEFSAMPLDQQEAVKQQLEATQKGR